MFDVPEGTWLVVEFRDGQTRDVQLKRFIVDTGGHPIVLESTTGYSYPWVNIISFRKVGGNA